MKKYFEDVAQRSYKILSNVASNSLRVEKCTLIKLMVKNMTALNVLNAL